jgi:hypothetical protein
LPASDLLKIPPAKFSGFTPIPHPPSLIPLSVQARDQRRRYFEGAARAVSGGKSVEPIRQRNAPGTGATEPSIQHRKISKNQQVRSSFICKYFSLTQFVIARALL